MNKLSTEAVNRLHANTQGPAATIYLPTHRTATLQHIREEGLRFKNLAQKASDILSNLDKHDPFNAFFKAQSEAVLENELFWKDRIEAVLICAGPDHFEVYDLTMTTDEYVAVDSHYHLAPAYGLLEDSVPFYVVAVTKDDAFLFAGDEYGLQLQKQYYKNEKQDNEAERHPYFRRVDMNFFAKADKKAPLILAGVSSDVAKYRSLSKYPWILDEYIPGSYGADSANELFSAGMPIINEELVEAKNQERLADYQQLKSDRSELASDEVANINDAAEKGRIDTLFIGMRRNTTDTIDDSMQPETKITFPDEIESQAIDYISRMVWAQRGHIININEDLLPSSSLLYAIYRY